jgi:branched-chain amino acid transport system permease protein
VAGGLLAGSVGKLYTYQFPTRDSIILLAVVLMGGIYSLWGAVVAGALMKLLPALLDDWGLPADLLIILFGIGVLQVLLTAPGGLAAQVPRDLARLGRTLSAMVRRAASVPAAPAVRNGVAASGLRGEVRTDDDVSERREAARAEAAPVPQEPAP